MMFDHKITGIIYVSVFFILGLAAGSLAFSEDNPSNEIIEKQKQLAQASISSRRPVAWTKQSPPLENFHQIKSKQLNSMLIKLLKGDIPEDWESELENILKITHTGYDWQKAMLIFFSKWSDVDFEKALQRASKLGYYSYEVKKELLLNLGNKDPLAALEYFHNNPEIFTGSLNTLNYEILDNWVLKSPEEAWDWCRSLEGEEKSMMMSHVVTNLALHHEEQAKEYIEKLKNELPDLPGGIMEAWASISPVEAINWVVSNEPINEDKLREAIIGVANKDLKMARELLLAQPENQHPMLIRRIADQIKNSQGEEDALTWTLSLIPQDKIKEANLSPLQTWTSDNPDESRKWIQKLHDSPAKDTAISIYAQNVPSRDLYDNALELITGINNEEKRKSILRSTIQYWEMRQSDSDELQKWLDKSKYSDLVRPYLQEN